MTQSLPPQPATFWDGLKQVGVALEATAINLYYYAPYIVGYAGLDYMLDGLRARRPTGSSEMTDDFWHYSLEGTADLSKQLLFGYTGVGSGMMMGGSNTMSTTSMGMIKPGGYSSHYTPGSSSGLMGAMSPITSRTAGIY
jgi:hypothetical protein